MPKVLVSDKLSEESVKIFKDKNDKSDQKYRTPEDAIIRDNCDIIIVGRGIYESREILKTGERVKAYCYEVKKELKGHQIFLSRAHPQFLAKLFFQEVPEI